MFQMYCGPAVLASGQRAPCRRVLEPDGRSPDETGLRFRRRRRTSHRSLQHQGNADGIPSQVAVKQDQTLSQNLNWKHSACKEPVLEVAGLVSRMVGGLS